MIWLILGTVAAIGAAGAVWAIARYDSRKMDEAEERYGEDGDSAGWE